MVGTKPVDLPEAVSLFNHFDRSADCLNRIIFECFNGHDRLTVPIYDKKPYFCKLFGLVTTI